MIGKSFARILPEFAKASRFGGLYCSRYSYEKPSIDNKITVGVSDLP